MKNKIIINIIEYGKGSWGYKIKQKGKLLYTHEGFEQLFKALSKDIKEIRGRRKDDDFDIPPSTIENIHENVAPFLDEHIDKKD